MHSFSQRSMEQTVYEGKEKKCPDCGSFEIVMEKGEIICRKCGYVFEYPLEA